jgi:hypothetical protein
VRRQYKVQFPPLLVAVFGAISAIALAGCDDGGSDASADAGGDGGADDGGVQSPAETCIACHLAKEALLASLEADPLPEEEEDPESTGEG